MKYAKVNQTTGFLVNTEFVPMYFILSYSYTKFFSLFLCWRIIFVSIIQ